MTLFNDCRLATLGWVLSKGPRSTRRALIRFILIFFQF